MSSQVRQTNFGAGELSPLLWGRSDLSRWQQGLRRMRDFFASRHGAAVSRPGTTYVGPAKHATRVGADFLGVRLVPFVYSDEQSYVLEVGQGYIRFHSDGGTLAPTLLDYDNLAAAAFVVGDVLTSDTVGWSAVVDKVVAGVGGTGTLWLSQVVGTIGADVPFQNAAATAIAASDGDQYAGSALEVVTTYLGSEVGELQWAQSGDVLTIVHPNHPPANLSRLAHTNWTLEDIDFARPGFSEPLAYFEDSTANPLPTEDVTNGMPWREWTYAVTLLLRHNLTGATVESAPYVIISKNNKDGSSNGAGVTTGIGPVAYLPIYPALPVMLWLPYDNIPSFGGYSYLSHRVYRGRGSLFGWIGDVAVTSDGAADAVVQAAALSAGSAAVDAAAAVDNANAALTAPAAALAASNQLDADILIAAGGGETAAVLATLASGDLAVAIAAQATGDVGSALADLAGGNATAIAAILTGGPLYDELLAAIAVVAAANASAYAAAVDAANAAAVALTAANEAAAGAIAAAGTSSSVETFRDVGQEPDYAMTPPQSKLPFTGAGDYPAAVAYFEERLVFGGTGARPGFILFSATGDYYNFDDRMVPIATEALAYELACRKREDIRAMVGLDEMVLGTGASVWSFGFPGENAQPNAVPRAHVQAEIGCRRLPFLTVGQSALWARNKGGGVRSLVPGGQNGWQSGDLSMAAQHFFTGTDCDIVDWCYAEDPWGLIWVVRADGALLSLTYSQPDEMWAWAMHTPAGGGKVRAICAAPEGNEDAVYLVVERETSYPPTTGQNPFEASHIITFTPLDTDILYLERMTSRVRYGLVTDDICLDAALKYEGAPTLTLTGLNIHEAKQVYVVAKGNPPRGPFTVASGAITLDELPTANSGTDVVLYVGLLFQPELETLNAGGGTHQRTTKSVAVEVAESRGFSIGQDFNHLKEWHQRKVADNYGTIEAISETVRMPVSGVWSEHGRVAIRQTQPLPLTVLGVCRDVEAGE